MLRPRIIPTLLIHESGLVKTVNFKSAKYVGDPINAVRIFNEKEVDELAIFDIDATVKSLEPNYGIIERIANQSRMPLCYGGGIKNISQAKRIFSLGVEKISLSSGCLDDPNLITEISNHVGAQSVVVTLDVRRQRFGGYRIYTHNGKKSKNIELLKFVKNAQSFGAGEIVINSIDRDGLMNGYDLGLVEKIRAATTLPVTILGGAGSLKHLAEIIGENGIIGVAAGSLFVFKGPYKAVLINYPSPQEKDKLYNQFSYEDEK
ncbi:AglZ/HisF2 family acetamidino modification protein [Akkermansiaceae bacterium]|nr:AglZ/HisF2 family acetamidino modification protein [Akkermansiaceae bacterium]